MPTKKEIENSISILEDLIKVHDRFDIGYMQQLDRLKNGGKLYEEEWKKVYRSSLETAVLILKHYKDNGFIICEKSNSLWKDIKNFERFSMQSLHSIQLLENSQPLLGEYKKVLSCMMILLNSILYILFGLAMQAILAIWKFMTAPFLNTAAS